MPIIQKISARQILDSRGHPTIEATVITAASIGIASVPSGASTGSHEAVELRDGTKEYGGLGVSKAVRNVNTVINTLLVGKDAARQKEIDTLMIKKDGTPNKKKLGANAILAVSLACAKAAAGSQPLYAYLPRLVPFKTKRSLPRPFFNVINGGKHADNNLAVQEFMIAPRLSSFKKNLQAGSEIYHALKKILESKYGKGSTTVGDEGGFAPSQLKTTEDALKLLLKAIEKAGYKGKVDLALDCAASEFYKAGKYVVDGRMLSSLQLGSYYLKLLKKYPLISIEDPFHEDDFTAFTSLRKKTKAQVVGDDLTVTNPERIRKALNEKSISCLLLKVNQIGTVTEALEAASLMHKAGLKVMVSHRSGETTDTFIADLAVALGCGMIKAGAPCRGERVAKYNRLLEMES